MSGAEHQADQAAQAIRVPEPHDVTTPTAAWDDLRRRLRDTRWPPAPA